MPTSRKAVEKSRARTVLRIDRRQQHISTPLQDKKGEGKKVQRDRDTIPRELKQKDVPFISVFSFPTITLPVEGEAGHRAVEQRSLRAEVRSGYLH